jgi:dihydroorotase
MTNPTRLDIAMPDDWHVHLRHGEMLYSYTAIQIMVFTYK